jgi:ectoine hydroxylase-related dioxygenase (phytanoyl-CoA dioxygenase family)
MSTLTTAAARFDAHHSAPAEIKKFYDDNGYVIVENVFTEKELSPIRARLEEIIADPSRAPEGVNVGRENDTLAANAQANDAENPVRNIGFMVRHDGAFQEFARSSKILELVRALIGPRVRVFRDQALQKPPGGQAKPLHQDLSYFRVQPADELVTAWVALENATVENGCMIYVPASHRHGLFDVTHDPERPTHHVPDTRGLEIEDEVLCPVPAGAVIFHHGYTLHRSDVNQTQSWRKSVQLHYAGSETRSDNEKLNQEVSLEID